MTRTKKITIFGATGRTGRRVLAEALARGWSCRAFVRSRAKLAAEGELEILEGDARTLADVRTAIEGVDAVFCCLGMQNTTVPATDLSDSLRTIVQAMHEVGVRRIVAIASAGVLDHPEGGYRNKTGLPPALQHISAEHVRNYETLRDSTLDWTVMGPSFLKADIPLGSSRYRFEDLPPGGAVTGIDDLAHTMVALVDDPQAIGKRVGILSGS